MNLKFEITARNDMLPEFDHSLKFAFYKEADQPDRQWQAALLKPRGNREKRFLKALSVFARTR